MYSNIYNCLLEGEQCLFPVKSQCVTALSQTVPVYDTTAYPICGTPRHNEQYPALRNRIESLINVTQIAYGPPSDEKLVRMRLRFLLRVTE